MSELPQACPACRTPVPPGARFCPACAAPIGSAESHQDQLHTLAENKDTQPAGPAASAPAFPPGTVIDGKYEVRERLGTGGFGEVYRVHHAILERDLALKTLHPLLVRDPRLRARFHREARILMDLCHPNVVTVRDVGDWDGLLYLVMDYCAGETLQAVLRKRGTLPATTVAAMALPVLRALEYAHGRNVVHRDLKPANLIITAASPTASGARTKSDVKVLDFGVAKVVGEEGGGNETANLTGTGVAIGTLHYMSPEQASGDAGRGIDGRADLYSLGAVLFEAVAGRRPFEGENQTQIYKKVLLDPPPRFSEIGIADHLPGFENLIRRCLAKDPNERPANARALMVEIEGLLRGRPASFPGIKAVAPAARIPKSVAALAGVLVLAGVLGGAAAGLGWFGRAPSGTHLTPENRPVVEPPANAPENAPPANAPVNAAGPRPVDPVPANLPDADPPGGTGTQTGVHPPGNGPEVPTPPARPYPDLPWAPTLADPALPPALPEEWGAPGQAYRQACDLLPIDRDRARQTLQDLARSSERGIAAHAQAALLVLEVRDKDLPRVEEGLQRLAHDHPDAPVTARLRDLVELLRQDRLRAAWEKVRLEAVAALPQGELPAVPDPYADARRIVAGFIDADPTGPMAGVAKKYLADLEREEAREVEDAYERTMRSARGFLDDTDWDRARNSLDLALGFRPGSAAALAARKEVEARLSALREVVVLDHPDAVLGVGFSPDGKRLASACKDKLGRVWDLEEKKAERTLKGHTGAVNAVLYLSQGKRLATAGADGIVRLWDASTGKEWRKLTGHKGAVLRLAADARGEILASAGVDGTVRTWNVGPAKPERSFPLAAEPVIDRAPSADGGRLAAVTEHGEVRIWSRDGKMPQRTLPNLNLPYPETCVLFAARGSMLVTGAADGMLRQWLLPPANPRPPVPAHDQPVRALAYHPPSNLLASADETGLVRLWEMESWQVVATYPGHVGAVRSLDFSPDGKLLASGGDDKTVRVHNVVR